MAKISIGLRGWRFEESDVFDDSGELRPLDEIPEDARHRLLRLTAVVGEPCDACWLETGGDSREMNRAAVVYGEPVAEVLLCRDHESDFIYWFTDRGGEAYAGSEALPERFHEWFDDGGRAPEGYEGLEHLDRDPDAVPEPSRPDELDEVEDRVDDLSDDERTALDLDLDDLDV